MIERGLPLPLPSSPHKSKKTRVVDEGKDAFVPDEAMTQAKAPRQAEHGSIPRPGRVALAGQAARGLLKSGGSRGQTHVAADASAQECAASLAPGTGLIICLAQQSKKTCPQRSVTYWGVDATPKLLSTQSITALASPAIVPQLRKSKAS